MIKRFTCIRYLSVSCVSMRDNLRYHQTSKEVLVLTTNQINLLKVRLEDDRQRQQLTEDRRHNLVSEGETSRHNRETESHNRSQLASTDAQWKSNLQETSRHNLATERETERSNLAREKAEIAKLEETHRSNLRKESQVDRELAETKRSNIAREAETQRSNLARESENVRSNVASEAISMERNAIQRDSDIRTALQRAQELEVTKLKQEQDFQTSKDRNLETLRHNLAMEDQAKVDQDIARERIAQDDRKLEEVKRSNRVNETIQRVSTSGRIATDTTKTFGGWIASIFD